MSTAKLLGEPVDPDLPRFNVRVGEASLYTNVTIHPSSDGTVILRTARGHEHRVASAAIRSRYELKRSA